MFVDNATLVNDIMFLLESDYMEQEIDETNKIIHIICTEEEKDKIISELSSYLYDYQFNFIIQEGTTNSETIRGTGTIEGDPDE